MNCSQNVFICSNAPFVSREIIISKEPNYKQSEHQCEVLVLIVVLDLRAIHFKSHMISWNG